MPSAEKLPDDLKPLARRQAVELRDTRWDADAAELISVLGRQLGDQPVAAPARRTRNLAMGFAAVLVGAAFVVPLVRSLARTSPRAATASPARSASPAAADTPIDPDVVLDYQITALPNPERHPGGPPVQVVRGTTLSAGDFVRFSFHSPGQGFLYVLNEGPPEANHRTSFNVLFPSPTTNNGSPHLIAGQTLLVPEHGDGFQLDEEQGSERLWLVWSVNAVNELDAVSHWANPRDQGEVKSAQDVELIRNFLTFHASPAPEVEELAGKGTTLKGRGQTFVKLVTLEHRR
jgi:hypothetical protein